MNTPRKTSAAAASAPRTADSPASLSQDVGEAPGSPAYFGEAGSSAEAAAEYAMVPDTGPGNPPGSAEYWGVDPAVHAASRGPDGAELPLPTVGEPPGSPSYFGTSGG